MVLQQCMIFGSVSIFCTRGYYNDIGLQHQRNTGWRAAEINLHERLLWVRRG